MTETTKQFLDNFEYESQQIEDKKYRATIKSKRHFRICPPPSMYDYPIYKDLKEVIICNDLSKICPRRWDELEIDFEDKNKRYSSLMQRDILKVTNEHNYNLIKDQNICIAIPYNGVLQQRLFNDLHQYIKEYIFIQISRRIIMDSGYSEKYDINTTDKNEAIKFIFEHIRKSINENRWCDFKCWVQRYKEYDIALEDIINNSDYKEIFNQKNNGGR